jgi:hypothetical protein
VDVAERETPHQPGGRHRRACARRTHTVRVDPVRGVATRRQADWSMSPSITPHPWANSRAVAKPCRWPAGDDCLALRTVHGATLCVRGGLRADPARLAQLARIAPMDRRMARRFPGRLCASSAGDRRDGRAG